MAEIVLSGASMTYPNGTQALREVDLTVREGEFLVLLGPSGCGKTTLLRLIAGLEKPTQGEVIFDGKVVNDRSPMERNVAMVFQNYALYPHLTVYKNIAFPLRSRRRGQRLAEEEIRRRVEEAARILDIDHVLNRRPRVLSGGQRQRVALGRAMVREPVVFLLDEPLSNLDAQMRMELREQIVSLHRRLGTTFVYVTHDQAEAMQLGERLAVMQEGRIVQTGTPQQIYNHPSCVYVADFVGAPKMNFFGSFLRREGGKWTVGLLGARVALPAERLSPDAGEAREGMRVIVGVRPEDLRACAQEEPADIEAEVGQVMPMGATLHVEGWVAQQRFLTALANHTSIRTGARLRLRVNPWNVHVFDAQSKTSLLRPVGEGD